MLAYLYEWMQNIAFYMIMVTAVMHIVPNPVYKRYIRFFTGLALAVMLTDPILKLLGTGDLWKNLHEAPGYREQVERMEEAARYLGGVDMEKELGDIWAAEAKDPDGEAEKDTDIRVEEIRIGN